MGGRSRERAELRALQRSVWGPGYYEEFHARLRRRDWALRVGRARRLAVASAVSVVASVPLLVTMVGAASPANFTTDVQGVRVNANHYAAKCDVYVNGGPDGARLRDGGYFFAVLAPSGQSDPRGPGLLSNDPLANRRFSVNDGVVVHLGSHPTSVDRDNGEILMSLCIPGAPADGYADTPNPGGVYIAAICEDVANPKPSNCKYDAFKVAGAPVVTTTVPGETTTVPEETTTTFPGETTTTFPGETTTVPGVTTTAPGVTTTTVPGETTTTVTVTVQGPTTPSLPLGVPTTAPAPAGPTTTNTVVSGPTGDLPRTGGIGPEALLGVLATAAGAVMATRRRRPA